MDKNQLKLLIAPALEKHHVDFYDSEFVKEGKDYYLRIFVDKPQGVFDLDTCVDVSEDISKILDQADPISHDYILEVSSAGVERPLVTKEDFIRSVGKYIWVVLSEKVENFDELIGTLKEADSQSIKLEIKIKTRVKMVTIAYTQIKSAMTTVKF